MNEREIFASFSLFVVLCLCAWWVFEKVAFSTRPAFRAHNEERGASETMMMTMIVGHLSRVCITGVGSPTARRRGAPRPNRSRNARPSGGPTDKQVKRTLAKTTDADAPLPPLHHPRGWATGGAGADCIISPYRSASLHASSALEIKRFSLNASAAARPIMNE